MSGEGLEFTFEHWTRSSAERRAKGDAFKDNPKFGYVEKVVIDRWDVERNLQPSILLLEGFLCHFGFSPKLDLYNAVH